jgi:hypothetical protein
MRDTCRLPVGLRGKAEKPIDCRVGVIVIVGFGNSGAGRGLLTGLLVLRLGRGACGRFMRCLIRAGFLVMPHCAPAKSPCFDRRGPHVGTAWRGPGMTRGAPSNVPLIARPGAAGFLTLSHVLLRPDRYRWSRYLDTIPSRPMRYTRDRRSLGRPSGALASRLSSCALRANNGCRRTSSPVG